MVTRVQRFCLRLGIGILGIGAVFKAPDLLLSHGGVAESDPILGTSLVLRNTLAWSVDVCGLAWLLYNRSRPWHQALCLTLLGGVFVVYHVARGIGKVHAPCPCVGSLWKTLGISYATTNALSSTLAWILFCCGVLVLAGMWPVRYGGQGDHIRNKGMRTDKDSAKRER